MHLPIHGYERILGRTKMHEDDVLAILDADVCVSLGKREGREYVLFYSSSDRRAKVAVVTAFRQVLITVLERNDVPTEIDRVTPDKCMEAKVLLQRYIWKRVRRSLATPALTVPVQVRVHAALYRKRERLLYLEPLGMIAQDRAQRAEDLAIRFASQLRIFMRNMGHQKNWARDRLHYTFELELAPEESMCLPPIRHTALVKLLRAAA